MNLAIQACLIIGTFALAYERLLELVRYPYERSNRTKHKWLDKLTCGVGAVLIGVAVSLATSANLLDTFRVNADQPRFFATYLTEWKPSSLQWWAGCGLMGFAVSLGAIFWHDLAKGLIDLRSKIKAAKKPTELETRADSPPLAAVR